MKSQTQVEVEFWLLVGVLGFLIGGIVGEIWWDTFLAGGFIGLAVVWGLPVCWHTCD